MNIVNIMTMGLAFLYLSLRHCTVNVFNVSISELRPNHLRSFLLISLSKTS